MLLVDTLKLRIRDYYLYGAFIRILFSWHYKAGIWSAKAVRYGCCRKRAYSSVSQSAPLIRVRSVVQLHIGPPVIYTFLEHWGYSSAGRAPALQAGGREFDPHYLHKTNKFFSFILINI